MNKNLDVKKIFGKVVSELRIQKGYTQEQLAEKLNLSPHTITRIETGNTFVSSDVITLLCNLFDVAPNVLFTPKPQILQEEHIKYKQEIIKLLAGFNSKKLKEIYDIMLVLKN